MTRMDKWLDAVIAEKSVAQLTGTTFKSNVSELETPGGDIYGLGEKFAYTGYTVSDVKSTVAATDSEPAVDTTAEPVVDIVATEEVSPEPEVDLQSMSKKELDEYASSIGLELDARKSKASMIEAILGA